MQNSTLYPTVYVLGNGQLGRMLRYAGAPLDIYVEPLAFNAPVFDLPENAIKTSLINIYLDYWPIVLLKNPCLMS